MRFRAFLSEMAESEILNMIPADKMQAIKARDIKPIIKAFVIGHEGESRGNLLGVGNIVKRWFGSMIEKLSEKINIGLQLFHGHSGSKDNTGRAPIGEVVGKMVKRIEGELSAIVACWIYPDYRHLPLDVASIEADVKLEGLNREQLYVADVGEVFRIALGNSAIDTPGFPKATLLGQLQAFVKCPRTLNFFEGDRMSEEIYPMDLDKIFLRTAIKNLAEENCTVEIRPGLEIVDRFSLDPVIHYDGREYRIDDIPERARNEILDADRRITKESRDRDHDKHLDPKQNPLIKLDPEG